jgi:hypothetical protein
MSDMQGDSPPPDGATPAEPAQHDVARQMLQAAGADYRLTVELRAVPRSMIFFAGFIGAVGLAMLTLMAVDILDPASPLRGVLVVADLIMVLGGLLGLGFALGQSATLRRWELSIRNMAAIVEPAVTKAALVEDLWRTRRERR